MMSKLFSLTIFSLIWVANVAAQVTDSSARWTWMKGSSLVNQAGVFGAVTVSDPNNTPGARLAPYTWRDATGNLWMFGGFGYLSSTATTGRINDMWKYEVATNQWTWMGGDKTTVNAVSVYGTPQTAAPANTPGGRQQGMTWTDASGNLWLFGGFGNGSVNNANIINDLWKYNPSTNQWAFMKGSTAINAFGTYGIQNASAPGNTPGARRLAMTWVDNTGKLWLFGGLGLGASGSSGYLNDLWRYDPAVNEWTWVNGSSTTIANGVYGSKGTPNNGNVPGGCMAGAAWADAAGNLWLFGGFGRANTSSTGMLNVLWRYEIATNTWTWMSGDMAVSASGNTGVYGTRGVAAAANKPGARSGAMYWKDINGRFWLYSGSLDGGSTFCSDLWRYDPVTNEWAWMRGPTTSNEVRVNGIQTIADFGNTPGARNNIGGANWVDVKGNFWLFAGVIASPANNHLNDLWKLEPPCILAPPVITASGPTSFCPGDSVVLKTKSVAGLTYKWRKGATIVGSNDTSYTASVQGSYTVEISDATCSVNSAATSVTPYALPVAIITPMDTAYLCQGKSLKLKANPGNFSYQWLQGSGSIGINDSSYVANTGGNYRVVITDNSTHCIDTSLVTLLVVNPVPVATTTPSGAVAFCQNDTLTITAAPAGTYRYRWLANNSLLGDTTALLKTLVAGNYRAIVTNAYNCSDTSAVVAASVNPLPVAQIIPSGTVRICEGDDVVLNTGLGGVTYRWKRSGVPIGGNIPTYTASDSGSYKVIITNGNQCTDSSAVTVVQLYTIPVVTITPEHTVLCSGTSVLLQTVTQDTGLAFQWKDGNGDIAYATAGFYQAMQSGTYYVVVSYTGICTDSSTVASVIVNALPDPVISYAANKLCAGNYYSTYKWYLNGNEIIGATDSVHTPVSNGAYVVAVTDTNGCSNMSLAYPIVTLGINNQAASDISVKVYPNPTQDNIHIQTSVAVQVTLYSLDGRVVNQYGNVTTIDISNIPDGIYILRIADQGGRVMRNERIVKQN